MPKYENALIYKLIHKDDYENANIYIGSTCNFKVRKNKHKSNCNNQNSKEYNQPKYQFIRGNGGWDEWDMIQLESFPCNNEQELKCRERYYIELMKSNLNKQIPTRTHIEYIHDNKEVISIQRKEYREINKIKLAEIDKISYERYKTRIIDRKSERVICECCGFNSRRGDLPKHKRTAKCLKAQAEKII